MKQIKQSHSKQLKNNLLINLLFYCLILKYWQNKVFKII